MNDSQSKPQAKPQAKSAEVQAGNSNVEVHATPVIDQASKDFTMNAGYKRENRGYPVEPGQTWHHLTHEQRLEWFRNHENRWKANFNGMGASRDMQPSQTWSRG